MRATYLFLSYLIGGTAVTYFVLYHTFLKKIREERNSSKNKDPKVMHGITNPTADLDLLKIDGK